MIKVLKNVVAVVTQHQQQPKEYKLKSSLNLFFAHILTVQTTLPHAELRLIWMYSKIC